MNNLTPIHLYNLDIPCYFDHNGNIVNIEELVSDVSNPSHSFYQQVEMDGKLVLRPVDNSEQEAYHYNSEALLKYKLLFLAGALQYINSPTDPLFDDFRELNLAISKWQLALTTKSITDVTYR